MGIFKSYDIRGIYSKELTEREAFLIGYYAAKVFDFKNILITHDGRLSYKQLTKFLILGFLEAGSKVIYGGFSSTPNTYYALSKYKDGIIVTASHNPKEYNGFKIMRNLQGVDMSSGLKDLEKLVTDDNENLATRFEELKNTFFDCDLEEVIKEFVSQGKIETVNINKDYINYLISFFEDNFTYEEKEKLKNYEISIDFSSGMSSIAMKKFCIISGLNCTFYNDEINGNFPNHTPDPLKAGDFIKGIPKNSDFFACFDGDGDRIIFYDENREMVFSDYIIAKFIEFILKQQKGSKFAYDLRVSRNVKEIIENYNGIGYESRVGRSYVSSLMKEKDCYFGGELSGHLFFKEFNYLDNPDLAFIYMLKIMANELTTQNVFSELFSSYKKRYFKLKEFNLSISDKEEALSAIKGNFSKYLISDLDGYSFNLGNLWFNVRKSNTEPVLRFNIEGLKKDEVITFKGKLLELLGIKG